MKEQLTKNVELLFAGAPDAEEIQQEILVNTLERYDDLVAQGKTPQAAYQLAISGIGDIHEILGAPCAEPILQAPVTLEISRDKSAPQEKPVWKKIVQAIGICLYIISPIPLFVLSQINLEVIGLCGMLCFVAVATALVIIGRWNQSRDEDFSSRPATSTSRIINGIIWGCAIPLYIQINIITNAWHISWIVFLIAAAVQALVQACMDLKEAIKNEK